MLPFTEIKVDYRVLTVTVMSQKEVLTADPDDLGSFHVIEGIKVHPCLSGVELADTVLHELMHAVVKFRTLKRGKDEDIDEHEERVVTNMAHGLTQIFRDNPEFARWYMETINVH
jgi:hypothetical protein